MKKLMTVMSVTATLFAFGAVNGSDLTYTGFENAPYVAGAQLSTTNDDAGKVDGESGFAATWAPVELDEGEAVVTAYETTPTIAGVDLGNNFLKLDTNNKQVSRYAQEGGEAVDIGDGLYIDTAVQFSAVEVPVDENGYPTNGVPEVALGDKLCIWLMMPEDGNSTTGTVVVTAGYVNDDIGTDVVQTNYVTGTKIENNSWHRLQVKVLKTIDSEATGALGDGFVVLVDGNVVATTTCPINPEYVALYELNARAARYFDVANDTYSILPSLVKLGEDGDGEITSLSFQGSGAVDEIRFTDEDFDPIVIASDDMPKAVEGLEENGNEQYGVEGNLEDEAYVFGGVFKATVAGTYTATATLLPGYVWTDGSSAVTNIEWTIAAGGEPGADWVDTSDAEAMADIAGKTAQQAYGITGAIGAADATQLTVWASGVGNVAFSAASSINTDCFLLNIANNASAADIAAAKAEFKVSIAWNDTKNDWDITTLPVSKTYNGTITIKGSTDLTVPKANWDAKDAGDTFFYATLGL